MNGLPYAMSVLTPSAVSWETIRGNYAGELAGGEKGRGARRGRYAGPGIESGTR